MYQSWYAAHLNLLSPKEASLFLSWLQVLEDDSVSEDERRDALRALHLHTDLNLQIYAMPWIMRAAVQFADMNAVHLLADLCSDAQNSCAGQIVGLITQTDAGADRFAPAAEVINEKKQSAPSFSSDDYTSLDHRTDIIALLSVLLALPKEIAREAAENNNMALFLENAASGCFGRYAATLSFRLSAEAGIQVPLRAGLIRSIPNFYAEPDLVYAYLCSCYAEQTDSQILDDVFRLNLPERFHVPVNPAEELWIFTGCDPRHDGWTKYVNTPKHMISQLWGCSALLLAIRRRIRSGRDALRTLTVRCCAEWQTKLQSPSRNGMPAPWVPFGTNRQLDKVDPYTMVSAVTTAVLFPFLIRTVHAASENETQTLPFLLECSMNNADFIGFNRVSKKLLETVSSDRELIMPLAMLELALYVHQISKQIMKGYLNPEFPTACFRLITRYAKPLLRGQKRPGRLTDQQILFYRTHAVNCCIQAAYEESAGTMPWDADNKLFWLRGGNDSIAFRICAIVFTNTADLIQNKRTCSNEKIHETMQSISNAVILAYERYPNLLRTCFSEPLPYDWLNAYCRNAPNSTVAPAEILYSLITDQYPYDYWVNDQISLAAWGTVSPDGVFRFNGNNIRKHMETLLTVRVSKTAEFSPRLTESDAFVLEQFGTLLSETYQPELFSRNRRYLTAEALRNLLTRDFYSNYAYYQDQTDDDPVKARLRPHAQHIIQTAVSAVVSLSTHAPFYQWAVGSALLDAPSRSPELLKIQGYFDLVQLYLSLMSRQIGSDHQNSRIAETVYSKKEEQQSSESKTQILQWFIGQLFTRKTLQNWACGKDWSSALQTTDERNVCLRIAQTEIVYKDHPEQNNLSFTLWDPDAWSAAQNRTAADYKDYAAEPAESGEIQPLQRSFFRLLAEQPGIWSGEQKLVLIRAEHASVLVSAETGKNYFLPRSAWTEDAWEQLSRSVEDARDTYPAEAGLYLTVHAETAENSLLPQLTLCGTDETNLQYINLFSADEPFRLSQIEARNGVMYLTKAGFCVQIDAPPRDKQEYLVTAPDCWDITSCRSGKILLCPDTAARSVNCRAGTETETLLQYLGLQPGQVIFLQNVNALKPERFQNGSVFAFTRERIRVNAEIDSVSLASEGITHVPQNQPAVIVQVPDSSRFAEPNGIIWQYRLSSTAGTVQVCWLPDGAKQAEMFDVPDTEFGVSCSELHCGMLVHVSEDRTVRLAQNVRHSIIVRCLWPMKMQSGAAKITKPSVYLGEYDMPARSQPVYLVQDPVNRLLLAYPEDAAQPPADRFGTDIRNGIVTRMYKGPNYDTVRMQKTSKAKDGSQTIQFFYGKAVSRGAVRFTESPTACRSVYVRLTPYPVNGQTYYNVQRFFADPERIAPAEQEPQQTLPTHRQRLAQLYSRQYNKWKTDPAWLHDRKLHAVGEWSRDADGKLWFLPKKPLSALPNYFGIVSDDNPDLWTDRIPMLLQDPEITELYTTKQAYANIRCRDDGTFAAYPDETPGFELDRFPRGLNQTETEPLLPLFYIEQKHNPDIRIFEAYLGFRLAVPNECLRIQNGDSRFLFYGDTVSRYAVIEDEKRDTLILSVNAEDLRLSIEHCIETDRKANIVQYVQVNYQKEQDSVRVEKVSARSNERNTRTLMDLPKLRTIRTGRLTDDTAELVRQNLPNGGTGVLICSAGKFQQSARKLYFTNLTRIELYGKILCMTGSQLLRTATENDYIMVFVPKPDSLGNAELIDPSVSKLTVSVPRRNYSYYEAALRRKYEKKEHSGSQPDELQNYGDMLVRIGQNDAGCTEETHGLVQFSSVLSIPPHSIEQTADWIRHTGEKRITFGKKTRDGKHYICEIEPNVLCLADAVTNTDDEILAGASGRLFLKNGTACAEPLSEPDLRFAQNGRLAELMPRDNAFRSPAPDKDASAAAPNTHNAQHERPANRMPADGTIRTQTDSDVSCSVAGLPQLRVTAEASRFPGILRQAPPRIGRLYNQGRSAEAISPDIMKQHIGYIRISDHNRIAVSMLGQESEQVQTDFSRLSFLDADYNTLVMHISKCRWNYHDRTTLVKQANGRTRLKYGMNNDLPVVFDEHAGLRYPFGKINRYAYPPHQAEDHELLSGKYPVAYAEPHLVYAETSPGRIIAVTAKQMYTCASNSEKKPRIPETAYLDSGDLLTLSTEQNDPGTPNRIMLTEVRYGIRAFIRPGCRAFLPVRAAENGSVKLGTEAFSMTRPVIGTPYEKDSVLRLDAENRLSVFDPENTVPQAKDCLMLRLSPSGEQEAVGFPAYKVNFLSSNLPKWVQSLHVNPPRRPAIHTALGALLPVAGINAEPDTHTLTLGYTSNPRPQPNITRSIPAQVIGILDHTVLLLRAGILLLRIQMDKMLKTAPKLTAVIMEKAAENVFRTGEPVWVCGIPDSQRIEYRLCLYPPSAYNSDERQVSMLFPLDSSEGCGFFCRDKNSLAYYWLPLKRIARAADATAYMVWEIFELYRKKNPADTDRVQLCKDGTVSWVGDGNSKLNNQFNALQPNNLDATIPVIVDSESLSTNKKEFRYLCHERPYGNIYTLLTEHAKRPGEAVYAVCTGIHRMTEEVHVVLTARDDIRTPLPLSPKLIHALDDSTSKIQLNRNKLQKHYPDPADAAALFRTASQQGFDAASPDASDPMRMLIACYGESVRLHRAGYDSGSSIFEAHKQRIQECFAKCREYYESPDKNFVTLAAAVAAAALTADIKQNSSFDSILNEIRMRHRRDYICEETLLKNWLLLPSAIPSYANPLCILDYILLNGKKDDTSNPEYAGKLSNSQRSKAEMICGLTIRRNLFSTNSKTVQTAQAVLYAVSNGSSPMSEQCEQNSFIRKIIQKLPPNLRTAKMFWDDAFCSMYETMLKEPWLYHIGLRNPQPFIKQLSISALSNP